MKRAKRILVISDFKNEKSQAVFVDERRIVKGLIRTGNDVVEFSHRNMLMQCSPIANKRIARYFAHRKVNKILLEFMRYYYPDYVFALCMKELDADTVKEMRRISPNTIFLGRDGDPFPENFPKRVETGAQMDIMTMPSSGQFLEVYKNAGVKCCAFIPFCCDPDIQYKFEIEQKWQTDIVFTGKEEHSSLKRDEIRYNIVKRLKEMPNVKLYGCFGRPRTLGLDCFRSLSNAKIGLSVNITSNVRLYHSDRYINIPACGTFTLAKRTQGYEMLFEDGVHMKYFDSEEEFFELADWYLKHDDEREKIAKAGMERSHREFNCTKIAGHLMDLVEKGKYEAPWAEIL